MKNYEKFILIPFGIIFIFICLLLKLFGVRVSFFEINNKYFGHFALDIAIKGFEAKKNNSLFVLACFTDSKSVNSALEEIVISDFMIFPRIFLIPAMAVLNKINRKFTSWIGYVNFGQYREFEKYPILGLQDCRIYLTDNQMSKSNEILDKYGLKNKNFICLAIRDEEYHAGNINNRFQNYRNIDFSLFKNIIINNKDYIFIKMGKSSIETKGPENFIDYSYIKNKNSDLEDLILINSCSGLISSGEGVSAVANAMKKPVLYLSHSPYEVLCTFSAINWIVPAIYTNNDEKIVQLNEVLMSSEMMLDLNLIKKRNYRIKKISQEEACEYCNEFLEYLKKTNNEKYVINEISNIFWSEYKNLISEEYKIFHENIKANIPLYFIKKYGNSLINT